MAYLPLIGRTPYCRERGDSEIAAFDYDALHDPNPQTAGETVARAKRTARAEARRRYRAVGTPGEEIDELEPDDSPPARRPATSPMTAKSTGTPPRMGVFDALKASIRPIHVREDIAALPWIAVHTKALWIPVLVTIAATAAVIAVGAGEIVTAFLLAYFITTPAIGGVFIAGFLAPRASWLLGVIVGLVSAACYSLLVIVFPAKIFAGAPPDAAVARDVAVSAFVLSPILGGLFAASAAWYRRFLFLSNPNRGRRNAQKQAQKRPGDGRTRGPNASQKAGAKR